MKNNHVVSNMMFFTPCVLFNRNAIFLLIFCNLYHLVKQQSKKLLLHFGAILSHITITVNHHHHLRVMRLIGTSFLSLEKYYGFGFLSFMESFEPNLYCQL